MFNGVQEINIDSKGRMVIPAKFRDSLSVLDSQTLCITLRSRSHLLLYPEIIWEDVRDQLKKLPTGNSLLQGLKQAMLGNMEKLTADSSGRILLPPRLRSRVEFAEQKEVVMVGQDDHLEIWLRSRWDETTDAILDIDPAILDAELAKTDLRI